MPVTGPWPVIATGVAVSVQSEGTFPDPAAAPSTTLARVRVAGWSVFVMVHVAASPAASVTVTDDGSLEVAPVQAHSDAE